MAIAAPTRLSARCPAAVITDLTVDWAEARVGLMEAQMGVLCYQVDVGDAILQIS